MTNQATFGGGCFWCTEAVFQRLKGVVSVEPGYSGGTVEYPSTEQVSMGHTGHVEVARVEFDPAVISFRQLLEVFFGTHDPTQQNRQGDDVGAEYRSVIFYHDEGQRHMAESAIKQLEAIKLFHRPIATAIEPLKNFYPASAEHRNYYEKNVDRPYCQVVINPKLAQLRQKFARLLNR